jgi:hypothetical protein
LSWSLDRTPPEPTQATGPASCLHKEIGRTADRGFALRSGEQLRRWPLVRLRATPLSRLRSQ